MGDSLLITHIEDEPDALYAQLVAEGILPGMPIHIVEHTLERIRFCSPQDEHVLAPMVAANLFAIPAPANHFAASTGRPLAALSLHETAKVKQFTPACRGMERRRLMDLGILPGTPITVENRSPFGDPTAYRVRGTVIALRREQAGLIRIAREEPVAA